MITVHLTRRGMTILQSALKTIKTEYKNTNDLGRIYQEIEELEKHLVTAERESKHGTITVITR